MNQAESTVRELALLNQLFSVQVLQQGEQIELLYRQVSTVGGKAFCL